MKIFYIITFILTILLFMPVKVEINKDEDRNDLKLYFIKIFNIKIDLSLIIKKIIKSNDSNLSYTFRKNYEYYKNHKSFFKSFINLITIKKITIIVNTISLYTSFAGWNVIYAIRNYLKMNLIDVENEYYNVMIKETNSIKIEVVFYVRLIYFIVSYVINIKEFIKKRGIKNVRSSN